MKPSLSRILGFALFTVVLASFTACASKMGKVHSSQIVTRPEPGKALVYFVRSINPTTGQYGVVEEEAPLYDNDRYVGTISVNSHLAHQATAGEHLFMVIGDQPNFARATLAPGKTYYVKVSAAPGRLKKEFTLEPGNGRASTAELEQLSVSTPQLAVTAKGQSWADGQAARVASLKARYLPKWEARLARDKREEEKYTLRPEDGK